MTGAISHDWESCQFPFVLDEKSAIVPIGSAGERPEARTGSLWRRSVELRVSRAVGLRWQAVFGCQIVWVNTNWGLKTYDFGPSQDTFGLFSASLESLTQKIADSVASRLGPALR